MGEQIKKSNMSGLLVLLIFAAFMVSVLLVLLTGADVVQKLTQRDQASFDRRTAAQYVATRVRQADCGGMIAVRSFDGRDTLVLAEEIEGTVYETLVYCHEGCLREMFVEAGMVQEPEFGEKILPMQDFRVTDGGRQLQLELDYGENVSETLCLYLRSEREADE